MTYEDINDYELLMGVSEDEEYVSSLFDKYKPLITKIATKMYQNNQTLGLDLSDLIQEGMIGFSVAINTFNQYKDTLFYTYAKTCVERRLISVIKSAYRFKNLPLNESYSVDNVADNKIKYLVEDNFNNPELKLIDNENAKEIVLKTKKHLTDFESAVFELRINGFKYDEIADILSKDKKSIDNAISRIKTKMSKFLEK